ncbi:MAG: Ribose-phosphate pyrophosphokinase, partial [Candidatus Collierbacteria bacterium GW2011_GWB1_44_197]
MKDYLIFSGSSNLQLSEAVAKIMGQPLGKVDLNRFADGESRPWIQENVRGKTVFIVQSLSKSSDENFMELA